MKSRPVGITVLSVLTFLNGAVYAALAVLSLVNAHALAAVLNGLSPGGSGPANLHLQMGKFLPVYYMVMMMVTDVIALGFWKLKNWVRVVVLALIGLSLIAGLAQGFGVLWSGSFVATASFLVRVGVCVLVGWYLLSAKVRRAFRPSTAADGPQS